MRKFKVPIFTEEYSIIVVIGEKKELIKFVSCYTKDSIMEVERWFTGRGICCNTLPETHPIIAIDGKLNAFTQIATLAHEASHAMDYIADHIQLNDGEFRAHGIASVIRHVFKNIKHK